MSYVLTLVAASPQSQPLENLHGQAALEVLAEAGLSPTCAPIWLAPGKALDLGISEKPQRLVMQKLRDGFAALQFDVFINAVDRRRKKLLLADMDATIIEGETLDELAIEAGIGKQISMITTRTMHGEIDFLTALQERVALLKGLKEEMLERVKARMKLTAGARQLIDVMHKNGGTCVLVSGGFTLFTEHAMKLATFKHHHGNTLEILGGELSGRILPPVIDKQSKADFLRHYMNALHLKPENTMAIGDGANDIPMLQAASLGIGYRPKPAVALAVDNQIIHGDLTAALYAQGYTAQHVKG
jgi:phosphoserine phosphatase